MLNFAKEMQEIKPQKVRRRVPWVLGTVVLVLLIFLIMLQSSNLWKSLSIETATDTLLLYALSSLNFVAFIIFGFIFLRSILKLLRERRTFQLGAKIKTRLLLYFFAVSLMPIIAMAVFSYLFLNRALDRWFTQLPETVFNESREVQRQSLIDRTATLDESARMLASVLEKGEPNREELTKIAAAGGLAHIEIDSPDNRSLVAVDREVSVDERVELDGLLTSVRNGNLAEPTLRDGQGFDVAVVPMSGGRRLVVVPNSYGERTVNRIIESSQTEFEQLKQTQVRVRQVGLLTLGLLTFLLIFASSWVAFYIARGLTLPIQALALGADEIAKGNLGFRVDVFAEDELALLVEAFNQMSDRLETNAAELNERQRYIETVIETLPNGVISFDADLKVSTINRAALNILKLENANFAGVELDKLVQEDNRAVLDRLLSRAKRVGHASEQTVLQRENTDGSADTAADLPVALTAAVLPDGNGVVLVIEDLAELISAQRASAWQEVARRMAHEIKNPLTPIQLSAERIAKRFASRIPNTELAIMSPGSLIDLPTDDQTAGVVMQGTDTILREVRSLKAMVDEFSRFARLPNAKLETGDLNEIVRQAVTIYEGRFANIAITADLAADLPHVMIDAEQMKRIFVNLIENAVEAFEDDGEERSIVVSTRHEPARDLIVAEVTDNGGGIPPRDLQKLFQPYFSTKGRGTGLGLAIVERIIGEHQGKIKVVANQPRGAKFIIELPTGN